MVKKGKIKVNKLGINTNIVNRKRKVITEIEKEGVTKVYIYAPLIK
jgi:hypothetical protein